mmetsp:Transcript_5331/g.4520  ORF Transcript_5331/g.4520 Transcript_5331/m.4520 type:complete len:229 (-) Transcript_5331:45-731(-)
MNLDHVSVTFGYLIAQPILLFMETEMSKDEDLFNAVNKPDIYSSLSMEKIQEEDDLSSSVWNISDKKNDEKTKIYVKYLHIHLCKIYLSYNSNNLNIVNLYKGDLKNYITNLVDIKMMRVKIKEYRINDKVLLQQAVSKIITFYLNDLIYKQNLNILASVYPIRVTINIMKAFLSLVKSPLDSYMNEKYLLIGIYEGFSNFFSQITHEFSDVGNKLMTYLKTWKSLLV